MAVQHTFELIPIFIIKVVGMAKLDSPKTPREDPCAIVDSPMPLRAMREAIASITIAYIVGAILVAFSFSICGFGQMSSGLFSLAVLLVLAAFVFQICCNYYIDALLTRINHNGREIDRLRNADQQQCSKTIETLEQNTNVCREGVCSWEKNREIVRALLLLRLWRVIVG